MRRIFGFILPLCLVLLTMQEAPASAAAPVAKPLFGSVYRDVSPVFNVSASSAFSLTLNLGKGTYDAGYITKLFRVYADRACTIDINAEVTYDARTKSVKIAPPTIENSVYYRPAFDKSGSRSWGGQQKYYLVVALDAAATKPAKLKTPLRMMFSVGSTVPMPELTAEISESGNTALAWDSVPGATRYNVYFGDRTGLKLLTDVTRTSFNLTYDSGSQTRMNTLLSENYDYAVTAVVRGIESRLSNVIRGGDLVANAPSMLAPEQEKQYFLADGSELAWLPLSAKVQTRQELEAGSGNYVTLNLPVIWDLSISTDSNGNRFAGSILGTNFQLYASFDTPPTEEQTADFYPFNALSSFGASDGEAIMNFESVPKTKVASSSVPFNLTKTIRLALSSKPPARSLEQAILDGLSARKTMINLIDYPVAGDSDLLKETLTKIIAQSPLVLDERRFSFDYKSNALNVEYAASQATINKQQDEIRAKVAAVIASILTPDMSDIDKEFAIHDWIASNSEYRNEVFLEYTNGKDSNEIERMYPSAFNPYGVLIEGSGASQSYAESFKLLADEAGLPAIVMTGWIGGLPHVWNMVKISGLWYHVDVTNNDSGLPYHVFNVTGEQLIDSYSPNPVLLPNKGIATIMNSDGSYDYYALVGQYARTEEQLRDLLDEGFETGETFCVKIPPGMPMEHAITIMQQQFEGNEAASVYTSYQTQLNVLALIK
ncbi:transglutaminase domain-containing protein [Cohnella sp. GCM10027633]|uniref:transglutaminase domain-containing protein n=1 Tax=unclassified Cohnella TaxID=2636738 RepID=UPI00362CF9A3